MRFSRTLLTLLRFSFPRNQALPGPRVYVDEKQNWV
jgi:hypothetical protein